MNLKQLGILLVLVVVLGGAGLIIYKNQNKSGVSDNAAIGGKLLKDFPVNDVAHVTIKHGTNEVNLVKKEDLWRVAERNDYPANFQQFSEFLVKVRDLKAVQTEQVGPSQLSRLQLASGQGTNTPTVVDFKGASDKAIDTLLLGKMIMETKGSSQMGEDFGGWPKGRYVKVGTNSETVSAISTPFENIEPKPESWLSKDFLRVEKAKSVEVDFPVTTNSWKLTRETESGDWKLADAKPEEKLDSSKIASVSSPLSSPSFNDVLPGNKLPDSGTNKPTVIRIETFDGFNYVVNVGQKTNDNYPLTVSVTAQLSKERTPGKDEKQEDKAKLDKEFADQHQKLTDKLKQEQAYDKWTYLVSSWSVEPLMNERSQLLEEKKTDTEGSSTNGVSSIEEPKLENPPLPAITNTNK
jgi:hypothetical protein